MKKNLVSVLFLLLTISALSQNKSDNKDYYLQKSKHQKTAFYVFAGTGVGLIITGIILTAANRNPDTEYYTGGFVVVGGLSALAISLPFKIASNKNKKRAITFSITNEKLQHLNVNSIKYKSTPSLQLTISL